MNYAALTDAELIQLKSDGQAVETLIRRYKGLVTSLAKLYFLAGGDSDDLFQEGTIGLYKAITTYSEEHTKFSTYAYKCIKNALLDAIKSSNSRKCKPLKDYLSLTAQVGSDAVPELTTGNTPETIMLNRENGDELLCRIKKILSVQQFRVFLRYFNGEKNVQIAQAEGVNVKKVSNTLQLIKKKVRVSIAHHNLSGESR